MATSSASEVLSVILPSVLLVFICTTITTAFHSKLESLQWRCICDLCIVIIPQIFNITILVKYMPQVIALLLIGGVLAVTIAYLNKVKYKYKQLINVGDKKNFVTNVRATINILTVIAILAVDFKIFPKQFKKQLKYGHGLMDVGVGLFVFANAIVAPEIRTRQNSLKKSIIDTVPLIILGVGRYIATRLTDYNVSVTEYGKHWNFFITLAVTRIISSILLHFLPVKFSLAYGALLMFFHEILLQKGLANYVLGDTDRDSLFSANREGITSTLGFVALYFLSVGLGIWLNVKEKEKPSRLSLLFKFIIATAILLPLMLILEFEFHVSRRLANSAYCIWVLFLGVFIASLFYLLEILQVFLYAEFNFATQVYVPYLMDAINYNGLLYFLLANILTGLVNMSCRTLLVSPLNSILILIVYMIVTSVAVVILYEKKIHLKLVISYLIKPNEKSYNV